MAVMTHPQPTISSWGANFAQSLKL